MQKTFTMLGSILFLAFGLLTAPALNAAEITVGTDKTHTTIQAAVDAAQSGDTIRIDAGEYTGSEIVLYKTVSFIGPQSGNDPSHSDWSAARTLTPETEAIIKFSIQYRSNYSNTVIDGLAFTAGGSVTYNPYNTNDRHANVDIQNNLFIDCNLTSANTGSVAPIYFRNTSGNYKITDITIKNNRVINAKNNTYNASGMLLWSIDGLTCFGNYIVNTQSSGINLWKNGVVNIFDNYIENCLVGIGIGETGITANIWDNIIIPKKGAKAIYCIKESEKTLNVGKNFYGSVTPDLDKITGIYEALNGQKNFLRPIGSAYPYYVDSKMKDVSWEGASIVVFDTDGKPKTSFSTVQAAVLAAQNNETVKIYPGEYAVYPMDASRFTYSGQGGWYLPVPNSGVTLMGVDANGNEIANPALAPVIYGESYSANSNYPTQNMMTVIGDGVTVQGLRLMPKLAANKTIEVLGKDVTLKNLSIECNTLAKGFEIDPEGITGPKEEDLAFWRSEFSGSILFNGGNISDKNIGNVTIENVTINKAWLSCSQGNKVLGGTLNIKNSVIDFRGCGYAPQKGYGIMSTNDKVTFKAENLIFKVDSTVADMNIQIASHACPGTTVEFEPGVYEIRNTINVDTGVTFIGTEKDAEGRPLTVFSATDPADIEPQPTLRVKGARTIIDNIHFTCPSAPLPPIANLFSIAVSFCQGTIIQNCIFDSEIYGIYITSAQPIIRHNRFENQLFPITFGYTISRGTKFTTVITENTFINNLDKKFHGIHVQDWDDDFAPPTNVAITSNIFSATGKGLMCAITVESGTDSILVSSNKFNGAGVQIYNSATRFTENSFSGDFSVTEDRPAFLAGKDTSFSLSGNYWGSETPNFDNLLTFKTVKGQFNISDFYTDSAMTTKGTVNVDIILPEGKVLTGDVRPVSATSPNGSAAIDNITHATDLTDGKFRFTKAGDITVSAKSAYVDTPIQKTLTVTEFTPQQITEKEVIHLSAEGMGTGSKDAPARVSQIEEALAQPNVTVKIEDGDVVLEKPVELPNGSTLEGNGNTIIYGGMTIGSAPVPSQKNEAFNAAPELPPARAYNVIFDGSSDTRNATGVTLYDGVIDSCVLRNWTATSSYGGALVMKEGKIVNSIVMNSKAMSGGGIYMYAGTVDSTIVTGNQASINGGGIYVQSGKVTGANISSNKSPKGAGITLTSKNAVIESSLVENNSTPSAGGGIRLEKNGGLVDHCVVRNNTSEQVGGGIHASGVSAANAANYVVRNTLIENNSANSSGGIYIQGGTLENSVILNNTAAIQATGIYMGFKPEITCRITNCLIAGNNGNQPAVLLTGGTTSVINCTITGNGQGLNLNAPANKEIRNTISWGNSTVDIYSAAASDSINNCVIGTNTGTTTFNSTVLRVDPKFMDAANGDYSLRFTSPCVDAGTAVDFLTDINGNSRYIASKSATPKTDIGAYEFQDAYAQPTPNEKGEIFVSGDEEAHGNGSTIETPFNLDRLNEIWNSHDVKKIAFAPGTYDLTGKTITRDMVLAGSDADSTLTVFTQPIIIAKDEVKFALEDATISVTSNLNQGAINLEADRIVFRAVNATLVNNKAGTANSGAGSANGIVSQLENTNNTVELIGSYLSMPKTYQRGINMRNGTDTIRLVNSRIYGPSGTSYCRAIALYCPGSTLEIENSEIDINHYALSLSANDLKVNVKNSKLTGFAAMYVVGGEGEKNIQINVEGSILTGRTYWGPISNDFAALVLEKVSNSTVNVSGSVIQNLYVGENAKASEYMILFHSGGGENNTVNLTNGTRIQNNNTSMTRKIVRYNLKPGNVVNADSSIKMVDGDGNDLIVRMDSEDNFKQAYPDFEALAYEEQDSDIILLGHHINGYDIGSNFKIRKPLTLKGISAETSKINGTLQVGANVNLSGVEIDGGQKSALTISGNEVMVIATYCTFKTTPVVYAVTVANEANASVVLQNCFMNAVKGVSNASGNNVLASLNYWGETPDFSEADKMVTAGVVVYPYFADSQQIVKEAQPAYRFNLVIPENPITGKNYLVGTSAKGVPSASFEITLDPDTAGVPDGARVMFKRKGEVTVTVTGKPSATKNDLLYAPTTKTFPLTVEGFEPNPENSLYVSVDGDANGSAPDQAASSAYLAEVINTAELLFKESGVPQTVCLDSGFYPLTASINMKEGVNLFGGFNFKDPASNFTNRDSSRTILDGNQKVRPVTFTTGFKTETRLDGVTVQHGWASYSDGGGVKLALNCIASNCIIQNNTAGKNGGGVRLQGSGIVENCVIRNNSALNGGGIQNTVTSEPADPCYLIRNCIITENEATAGEGGGIFLSRGTIDNCIITNNTATGKGGGVKLGGHATEYRTFISNSLIADNESKISGGGVSIAYNIKVSNCTVTGNVAPVGGGLADAREGTFSTTRVRNCILWDNTADDSNGDYFVQSGYDNIEIVKNSIVGKTQASKFDKKTVLRTDPQFVSPKTGDYRLTHRSGAIDWGDNTAATSEKDLDGNTRVLGVDPAIQTATVDMGAYEYNGPAELTFYFAERSEDEGPEVEMTYDYGTLPSELDDQMTMLMTPSFAGRVIDEPEGVCFSTLKTSVEGKEYSGNMRLPAGVYPWYKQTAIAPYSGVSEWNEELFVLTIDPVSPVISNENATGMIINQPISTSKVTATATFSGEIVPGTCEWVDGQTPEPGLFKANAIFTPNDLKNFVPTNFSVYIPVAKDKLVLKIYEKDGKTPFTANELILKKGATYALEGLTFSAATGDEILIQGITSTSNDPNIVSVSTDESDLATLKAENIGITKVTFDAPASSDYEATVPAVITVRVTNKGEVTIDADDQSAVYSATPQKGFYSVQLEGAALPETEYTVTYADDKGKMDTLPFHAGAYKMTITADKTGEYYGSRTVDFNITPFELNPDSLILADTVFAYTGKTPVLKISVDTAILPGNIPLADTELSIVFNPNPAVDSGIYGVTVTPIGNFTGLSLDTEIMILPAQPSILIGNTLQIFDGMPKSVSVTFDGEIQPAEKDYLVTYNGSTVVPTSAGTYDVKVTLNGNFSGEATAQMVIREAAFIDPVIGNLSQIFGSVMPITIEGAVEGIDYTITYNGSAVLPKNAGSYAVEITFKGNFSGSASAVLKIAVLQIPTESITVENLVQSTISMRPVSVSVSGITPAPTVADYTVTYNGGTKLPTNIGKYAVIVTFKGNYSGSKSAELIVTQPALPEIPTVVEPIVPGIVTPVSPSQIGLPETKKAPKAEALYSKPFARPGAPRARLHVSVKNFDSSTDTMELKLSGTVVLYDKKLYNAEKKSRFTRDILTDTSLFVQVDSLAIPVSFRTKNGYADSTITLVMRPPTLDSFVILLDTATQTTYYAAFGSNFGSKRKVWLEYANGIKMKRSGLSIVRKALTLVDSKGTVYRFEKKDNEDSQILMKMNRFYSDPSIERLDFVMDNRNGMDAITVR